MNRATKLSIVLLLIFTLSGCLTNNTGAEKSLFGISNNDQDLYNAINSGKPTIVEFYLDSCPSCVELAPIIKEVEKEHNGKLNVLMINANQYPKLYTRYSYTNTVPFTVIFDRDGKVNHFFYGPLPKDQINSKVDPLL